MRPRRIFIPGKLHLVTTRVQEGLPFTCTPYMELIVESALALAQSLYQVKICAYVVMGNHIHLILWVEDPKAAVNFMERFKTETAHAINRLLGRRQRSVWAQVYDSPSILTLGDVIDRFIYVLTNPQTADLVETIDEYPGLSSWSLFTGQTQKKLVPRVRRYHLGEIPTHSIGLQEQRRIAQKIRSQTNTKLELVLTPVSEWLKLFIDEEEPHESAEEIHKQILDGVREKEQELKLQREAANKKVMGADRLRLEPFNKSHTPKKFAKRMWCICSDISARVLFIAFIKGLIEEAKNVQKRWLNGDYSRPYPLGLFPPTPPRLGNIIPPYAFG